MSEEKTFIMLKPDSIKRGLIGDIIGRIERKGYRIIQAKMAQLDEAFLKVHYAHIAQEPFFPIVVEYMLSGPVLGLCVSGNNAIKGMRLLIGPTNFEEAQPGTIRGDYATSMRYNIIHASDSAENGEAELKRFFG